jgi:hypothetical protein
MDDTTLLIIGGGALAFFLLGGVGIAGAAESETLSVSGKGFTDKTLTEISGANWTVPLLLTLERNIPIGEYGLDTLFNVGTTIASGLYTGVSYVGDKIITALSTVNQVVSGTVIPAVISAGGTVASYVAAGAKSIYVGSGLQWVGGKLVDYGKAAGSAIYTEVKALPGQIMSVGKDIWKYTKIAGGYIWEKISGAYTDVKDYVAKSDLLKTAGKVVVGLAGSAIISKNTPNSDITNNPNEAIKGDIPGSTTPQLIPLGYLSKTPFDTPKSMIVKKLYNSQINDTRIVTDQDTYDASIQIGYKEIDILGYCSPEPFLGAANMISMFNPSIIDSIIITNYDVIPQMEKLGYKSLGTIGYCKALV